MDFHSMKRKELQALCKEHKIRANLTNLEMADRLSLLFKSSLINSAEKLSESDSGIAEKRLKKARFSTENENKRIGTKQKRSEITSAEVFEDKLVAAEGGMNQPEMGLRRSKRIADKHVIRPKMAVQNANRRKSMMPKIQKVRIDIPVADEDVLEDYHQKGLESTPKSCLKKQNCVYIELSDSEMDGNSVIQGDEELETEESTVVLSGTGVGDSMAEGNEELETEESPLSVDVVADNSVIATVNDDIFCCQTPLKGSDASEHGMPMSMGETSRKLRDEQETQEVIGAKEWEPMFSNDFEVFEKQMIAEHSESTSLCVEGMDGLKDQNDEQIVSAGLLGIGKVIFENGNESAILKADDCGKDTNDSHQFMEVVPQLDMKFGETDCHLKETVQGMAEKDFLVQEVNEVYKVKDVEATRKGIDETSGVPTEVLLVNEDGMEEDAAAKLLHGNETQTSTETNEGHASSDYSNDTSEEYHSNQKLCLQYEWIEASKTTLADRGAEIFEGIMSVREDSVYNDSVGVDCQESREKDMNFGETDCHLKEMVQGMDEKDLLFQKVVDVMKVKDVKATEVLLINEDGMEEDAATKLVHGNETQTSTVENNEAHGSSDHFNDSSEEYNSNKKLCLEHEWIKASKTTLADRGAEIFDGVMSVREDSVYDDSVGVGCQESREEATAVAETNKIDFEGNLCMDGAHHDFDGQLSLAGGKGMEITCPNSGDVKEIRTHETSIGETSSPIIFEETNIDRVSATVNDDCLFCQTPLKGSDESEQGIAMSLDETSRKVGEEEEPQEQNSDNTVNDDILCCQTPLKGSDGSEHGMPISISETSRKVGDEREPQEVMGEKESSDEFKVNMMQITEKEVTSPGSVEKNQLKILNTPDTTSTCSSEKKTSSHDAENVAISLENTKNTLNTMIHGRFSHGESLEVVELKESKDTQGCALGYKGEETTAECSNSTDATLPQVISEDFEVFQKKMTAELSERASLCVKGTDALKDQNAEQIVSPGLLGIGTVITENGDDSAKRNVDTLSASVGYLLEEGGGCCEILGEVMPEILSSAVFKADDCSKDCNDFHQFMEAVPQLDMNFGETDCGMDEKDILVQKVVDVEATEVLLINEDGMKEDAAAKLLHGNEAQTSAAENNEAHGSSDYLDESSEKYHSSQKLCLKHECIKVSTATFADRGAEIFDGIMSVGEDSVSNDSVEVGCQESREEAIAVEETTKIDLEGNLCMDGAHHDLDGQLSLVGEKGLEITCSNSGDVKEIRTNETPTGETSSPIIFEETEIDRAGIMCSAYAAAGSSATVIDYILHCQTPLKGSESEQGIAMSLDETLRKVGEEEEPQEVIEAKENDDMCLFKVNVMQNTEEEVFSPGSVASEQENQLRMLFTTPDIFSTRCNEKKSTSNDAENAEGTAFRYNESDAECLLKFNSLQTTEKEITSPSSMESEQENLLKILFVTPDTTSTSLSEQQTSSQAAEISAVSMSLENTLKKSILGRSSHGKSLEVVEIKEREVNERSVLKSKGEEIIGKGSNSIDEEIASPGPVGFIKVMFEDGNESVEGNVNTPFEDLLEEGGGCIEISSKVTAEILSDDVFRADDCGKDANDCHPFVETVPQLDMTIGETDCHLKELFLGMDGRDFLVQGVVDIMKVKDMETTRHGIDATDGKHFDLGGEASGVPTEKLLRNEDAVVEDAPAKLLHGDEAQTSPGKNEAHDSLDYLNDSSEHGDAEFTVDSDMLGSELKLFVRADEVDGDKSNAWSQENNFVLENSEDAGEGHKTFIVSPAEEQLCMPEGEQLEEKYAGQIKNQQADSDDNGISEKSYTATPNEADFVSQSMGDRPLKVVYSSSIKQDEEFLRNMGNTTIACLDDDDKPYVGDKCAVAEASEPREASSETKLRMADQPPAYNEFASDKVAAAVDVYKGQLEKDVVECKDTEAILEGNITVRHLFSTISTQKTPGKSLMTADMKENAQSFKRQPGSLIAAKSTKKRRALEEL